MTPLQAQVGQLSMSGGSRRNWAPNARAVEPASADRVGRQKGNLYILAELASGLSSPAVLYRQIVNVVQRVYYETPGTISSSLETAIQEAHLLLEEAHATGGISCVVLRDSDIYVAQVTPALVIVSRPDVVQLFPSSPESQQQPLGGRTLPDVALFHTAVKVPTTIVLAESSWLGQAEPRMLAGATTAPDMKTLLEVLERMAGRADVSAMVIGLGVPAEEPAVPVKPEVQTWAEGTEEQREAAPRPEGKPRPAAARPRAATDTSEAARTASGVARDARKGLATAGAKLAEGGRGLVERMLPDAEEVPTPARRVVPEARERVRERVPEQPKARSAEAVLEREKARPQVLVQERPAQVKPARPAQPARAARDRERGIRWPVVLAIAIPVVVALVALVVWWQRGAERERKYTTEWNEASTAYQTAVGVDDEATARLQLMMGLEHVQEALIIKPDDPDALSLERDISRLLDEINHVVPLPMLMPLHQFAEGEQDYGRILVEGDHVFILDRGQDQVAQLALDPQLHDIAEPAADGPLVQKGQQIGQAVVSELADMIWLEPGTARTKGGVLVLDQSGGLFLNDPDGLWQPLHLTMRLPQGWRYPQSIGTYEGYFYVLEPALNQIYRYAPTTNGYEDAPTTYFPEGSSLSLGGVTDMAISSATCGGNIYLLYRNGIIKRFTRGVEEPFSAEIPDAELQDTPAFYMSQETCHLFVADAGNSRILELDSAGGFLFQYRLADGDALSSARGLFVNHEDGAIYILTPEALYRTPLPR